MKTAISLCLATVVSFFSVIPSVSGSADSLKSAFDKVRALEGTWQGKSDEGEPATVKYEVMSGGTIVMETLKPGAEPSMLTVYHLDGGTVLCTHYCSRNNQPRMKLDKADLDKGTLTFDFVDCTNLANPHDGHMRKLTLKTPDKDHLVQEWSWRENGQDSQAVFNFERAK